MCFLFFNKFLGLYHQPLSWSEVYVHIVSKINGLVMLAVLHANVLLSWSGVCMHIVSKINQHCGANAVLNVQVSTQL